MEEGNAGFFFWKKASQKVKSAGFGRGIRTFLAGEPKKSIEGLANSVTLSGNFGLRDSASCTAGASGIRHIFLLLDYIGCYGDLRKLLSEESISTNLAYMILIK